MPDIHFSSDEKDILVRKIKRYFAEELRQEIGGFDAEFLLDFSPARWGSISTTAACTTPRPSFRESSMRWAEQSISWSGRPSSTGKARCRSEL